MGRLNERQTQLRREAEAARIRIDERTGFLAQMTAAVSSQMMQDEIATRWRGGWTVLALMFALPLTETFRQLDGHGDYLDLCSGQNWDLFWPGYFKSAESLETEETLGAQPVGTRFAKDWFFNATEFNNMRAEVEQSSGGKWRFSGDANLVLVNAQIPSRGRPVIDWESTIGGVVGKDKTLSVGEIVERISRDGELDRGDADYGVPEVIKRDDQADRRSGLKRDVAVSVITDIAVAIGLTTVGLGG